MKSPELSPEKSAEVAETAEINARVYLHVMGGLALAESEGSES